MEAREESVNELRSYLRRSRRRIALILKSLFAIVLLWALFQYVDFENVKHALFTAQPGYIAGAALLMIANVGLQVLKWRYFVRLVDPAATNLESAASLLFGITLGAVTPGQVGEFGGRALRHSSIPAGTIVGLTLVDKLQMMCVMGIAGVLSLTALFPLGRAWGTVIGTTSTVLFLVMFFRIDALRHLRLGLSNSFLQRPTVRDFFAAVAVFKPLNLVVSFCISVGFYLVIYLQMFLLLNAFSPVEPSDAFLGFASMMFLKSLLPISLGDLGIREASSVYLYSLMGIGAATALNASLLLFAINIVLPSLIGLVFIPRSRTHD